MSTQKTKQIGKIELFVKGLQYYDGIEHVSPGEELFLERDPDNKYDGNAIRVDNTSFEPIGYLPRVDVSYIAPLIDDGKIGLIGRAKSVNRRSMTLEAEIEVLLHPKGKSLLDAVPEPSTFGETIKDMVVKLYADPPALSDKHADRLVRRLLKASVRCHLPEVYLAINLLPCRIWSKRREKQSKHITKISGLIESIQIGEPVFHEGLTVFPLIFKQPSSVQYITLEEALDGKLAEITEIDEDGSVPELMFANKGESPVLIIDGEELVGAKQNRIINLSLLVQQMTSIPIPVSCVEQGRWSYRSRDFSYGSFASSSMRSKTSTEVRQSMKAKRGFSTDQGRVWNDVDNLCADFEINPETGAMADLFEAKEEDFHSYEEVLQLTDEANGYIACVGDRVLGADLFDRPKTLKTKWPRLQRGCAIEAMHAKEKANQTSRKVVEQFLATAAASVSDTYSPPGIGTGYSIEGEGSTGQILVHDDTIIHASLFPA